MLPLVNFRKLKNLVNRNLFSKSASRSEEMPLETNADCVVCGEWPVHPCHIVNCPHVFCYYCLYVRIYILLPTRYEFFSFLVKILLSYCVTEVWQCTGEISFVSLFGYTPVGLYHEPDSKFPACTATLGSCLGLNCILI